MGVRRSESIGKLAGALAKAHGTVRAALKESTNPHFRSRYADLASVVDACRDALAANEIAFPQPAWTREDGTVVVTTTLLHSSGEWIESDLSVKPPQPGPQALGSCVTYLRRYGLAAIAGVAPDDDDGEAAERPRGDDVRGERHRVPSSLRTGRFPSPAPASPSSESSAGSERNSAELPTPPVQEGGLYERIDAALVKVTAAKAKNDRKALEALEPELRGLGLKQKHPLIKAWHAGIAACDAQERAQRLADELPAWAGGEPSEEEKAQIASAERSGAKGGQWNS